MDLKIDIIVVVGFLLLNLAIGLWYGRGVKTISDYSVGNRNFSTATLAATIVATWVAGSDFAMTITEVYKGGIWYFVAGFGNAVNLLIVSLIFAPRMRKFFGTLSVAETMGKLFGSKVKLITAIASIATAVAVIAMQIKVFSMILGYLAGINNLHATLFCCTIVIVYSAFGGIKAVTFTDVIQFITFGVVIPVFAQFVWKALGDPELLSASFRQSKFDYSQLINLNSPQLLPTISLFLCFSIPALNPTVFQRILIAKTTKQVKDSFLIAAIVALILYLIISFITIVIYSNNSSLVSNDLMMYVMEQFTIPEFKLLLILGVIAMIMSTTDSWLNVGAVIFTNDICTHFNANLKDKLIIPRIFTIFMGFGSIVLVLYTDSLLELFLISDNFYKPIVTVPLTMAIFGFRSSQKVILIGITTAFITVIFWRSQMMQVTNIDSLVPGMVANLVATLIAHYLLKTPGGWTHDEDLKKKDYDTKSDTIKNKVGNLSIQQRRFNLLKYCDTFKPKSDIIYVYFALAVYATLITTTSIDKLIYDQNIYLVNILQFVVLYIATSFLCYMLWPKYVKEKYLGLIWCISVFTALVVVSALLIMLSQFSQSSLIVFTLHLIMIGLIIRWRVALLMVILGTVTSIIIYHHFVTVPVDNMIDPGLMTIYAAFMASGFMITMLRNRQEYIEETEKKVDTLAVEVDVLGEKVTHYVERSENQEKEIYRLGRTSEKILRNVGHEIRIPLNGLINFSEMLMEHLQKIKADKHVALLSKELYQSSERLCSMLLNMLDLSALDARKVELRKNQVNLSDLIINRIARCKKVYLSSKSLKFNVDIDSGIILSLDHNYIQQLVDNLVINAIKYSEEGKIDISLKKKEQFVEFIVTDEGIGVPKQDFHSIFEPFGIGSKTDTPAGGRGVGLALCKSAAKAHGGDISVSSDGKRGASFKVILPVG